MSLQKIQLTENSGETVYQVDPKQGKRAIITQKGQSGETSVELKLMVQISEIRSHDKASGGFAFETREATSEAFDQAISQLMALKKQVIEQVIDHTGVVPASNISSTNKPSSSYPRQTSVTFTGRRSENKEERKQLNRKHSHHTFGGTPRESIPPPSEPTSRKKTNSFLGGFSFGSSRRRSVILAPIAPAQKGPTASETVAFLQKGFQAFQPHGMIKAEGIYRIPANGTELNEAEQQYKSCESFSQIKGIDNPILVADLIKRVLRTAFELIPYAVYENAFKKVDLSNKMEILAAMQGVYSQLDPNRRVLLKDLLNHLSRVAAYSKDNKMNASNLALIFAAVITRLPTSIDILAISSANQQIADILQTCIEATDRNAKVHWLDSSLQEKDSVVIVKE